MHHVSEPHLASPGKLLCSLPPAQDGRARQTDGGDGRTRWDAGTIICGGTLYLASGVGYTGIPLGRLMSLGW